MIIQNINVHHLNIVHKQVNNMFQLKINNYVYHNVRKEVNNKFGIIMIMIKSNVLMKLNVHNLIKMIKFMFKLMKADNVKKTHVQKKIIIILIVMIRMLINVNNNVVMLIIKVLIKERIIKFVHHKIIVKMYKDTNTHHRKKINYVSNHVKIIHGINYII